MNFRSFSLKTVAAGLALAVGIPAMAMAANPFEDVAEGQWYTEPVDWAYNNGITTGKTPTTFNGWDETNRYEVVTFVHRYHENLISPALDGLDDAVDETVEMQFGMFGYDSSNDAVSMTGQTELGVPVSTSVTIPAGYEGVIVVEYSAESACYGGPASNTYCTVNLRVNGDEISTTQQAFDSTDGGSEGNGSFESHTVRAITETLAAGTYDISVGFDTNNDAVTFRLDDMTLTAEVQLTGEAELGIGF